MTGTDDRVGSADEESGAPIDFERLGVIKGRFGSDTRFRRIDEQPEFAPDRLVCVYNTTYYPDYVQAARLEIAWYENGDFSLHYHEDHGDDAFDHRWDRHPSDHNTLDHIHLGPDATTPGTDATHPRDWRDVLSMALSEIEDRQRGFWTE